ncbi:NAD(P)H-quinone oxidoreductase [Roseinatronobacter sp. S2]|uniref:NAD(P)H-quinone oxidoreductase n=1 Tax=Roseinatronobacter sp. S2 TaxID=3035471 RepID=UPI00240F0F2E|nr:NAD(P)H-quinone oxidoreductase [Roseinatronobacter sp. S2]WFE76467.1 NAD(P)H-quinone oxidoreductase [Roseinatronobacter sp. S2]
MRVPDTQTAIIITKAGGPGVLVPSRTPVPKPEDGQVLIRVSAAGVNRHDVHQRAAGRQSDGLAIPGLEVCGTVAALGNAVPDITVGARVMALVQGGGYGQYVLANAALVMPAPTSLSDIEAAAIPEAAFTTWWNFFGLMALQKDQFALIHGGTSGVGHIALQALSALGYKILATSGTEEKCAAARGFGADAAFLYSAPDLAAQVMAATGGRGISALVDVSAGAHLAQDLDMMAPDGTIAHLSGGGGAAINVPLSKIMARRIRITGSLLRPLPLERKARIADMIRKEVWPQLGTQIRPAIAHSFDFRDAAKAHSEMEKNTHIGKIMLTISHD